MELENTEALPPARAVLARLTRIARAALHADGAVAVSRAADDAAATIALLPDAGGALPPGFTEALLECRTPLVAKDCELSEAGGIRDLAQSLGGRAFLSAPFSGPSGARCGALLVWDSGARDWTADDLLLLKELVQDALVRWELLEEVAATRKREKELRLVQSFSGDIFGAPDMAGAIEIALRKVCEFTGWAFGEAWLPSADGTRLESASTLYALREDRSGFARSSASMTFARGEGIPGRVWESGQAVWERDLAVARGYRRLEVAAAAGVTAAVGIPVLAQGSVVAVVVFHAASLGEEDERLIRLISTVAAQLGSVVAAKRAEEARREIALRFRAIFNATYQFIGLLAPDGTLLEVNRTALEFAGVAREAVVGRPFWEGPWWSDPAARARLREAIRTAAAGEFVRFEAMHPAADGRAIIVDVSLTPVRDESGRVVLLIPEGRDISKRREIEDRLRSSEARFGGILEAAADAIISIDEAQHITLYNGAAERVFGFDATEVLGQPLAMLLPEDVRGAHGGHVRNFVASGVSARWMSERGQIRGRRKNGQVFPAEATISRLQLGAEFVCTVVLRDITERKQTEDALAATKRQLASIVSAAAEGIVEVDGDGCVTLANPAATAMLGLKSEEMLGRALHPLIHPAHEDGSAFPFEESALYSTLREKIAVRTDTHVFWRKDGTHFPVEYACTPHSGNGTRKGAVLTFRDISLQKEAERSLRALALRDELTGLYNRRGFMLLAQQLLKTAQHSGRSCSVFFMDMDDFKHINDTHGHPVGDTALVDIAGLIRQSFRESDVVARLAGDEFTVLAMHGSAESPGALIGRLEARIALHNESLERAHALSLSIGFAQCDGAPPRTLDELMAEADASLLEAKRRRRAGR